MRLGRRAATVGWAGPYGILLGFGVGLAINNQQMASRRYERAPARSEATRAEREEPPPPPHKLTKMTSSDNDKASCSGIRSGPCCLFITSLTKVTKQLQPCLSDALI